MRTRALKVRSAFAYVYCKEARDEGALVAVCVEVEVGLGQRALTMVLLAFAFLDAGLSSDALSTASKGRRSLVRESS